MRWKDAEDINKRQLYFQSKAFHWGYFLDYSLHGLDNKKLF